MVDSLTPLTACYQAFLLDREAARYSPKTLEHYTYTVGSFVAFLQAHGVTDPTAITPHHVRAFLVTLQERNLRDTTQHAHARGIKTFLRWLVAEGDLDVSPMSRVTMPKLEKRIPAPFTPQDIRDLLATPDRSTPTGPRDYAIVLALLDSGLRASEFCSLRVGYLDMRSGLATVLGKGGKQRTVIVGARSRGSILRMLAYRKDRTPEAPLWAACTGHRRERGALTVAGLQTVLHRMGRGAGVMPCSPHRFRRTFALWCLRAGMDLHSLRMLMGHADLTVLQRYLALSGEDLERAHRAHSPVDRLLGEGR